MMDLSIEIENIKVGTFRHGHGITVFRRPS